MGQEKHMALLGYDHLLLLLGHCGRFQDHYESTLVNDKENNEYSDDLSPLVNSFGDRALFFFFFWHNLHRNLESYMLLLSASCFIKKSYKCAEQYSNGLFKQSQYLDSSVLYMKLF